MMHSICLEGFQRITITALLIPNFRGLLRWVTVARPAKSSRQSRIVFVNVKPPLPRQLIWLHGCVFVYIHAHVQNI